MIVIYLFFFSWTITNPIVSRNSVLQRQWNVVSFPLPSLYSGLNRIWLIIKLGLTIHANDSRGRIVQILNISTIVLRSSEPAPSEDNEVNKKSGFRAKGIWPMDSDILREIDSWRVLQLIRPIRMTLRMKLMLLRKKKERNRINNNNNK